MPKMPPPASPISYNDLQTTFGGTNPISITEYNRGGSFVPNLSTNANIPTTISAGTGAQLSKWANGTTIVYPDYSPYTTTGYGTLIAALNTSGSTIDLIGYHRALGTGSMTPNTFQDLTTTTNFILWCYSSVGKGGNLGNNSFEFYTTGVFSRTIFNNIKIYNSAFTTLLATYAQASASLFEIVGGVNTHWYWGTVSFAFTAGTTYRIVIE